MKLTDRCISQILNTCFFSMIIIISTNLGVRYLPQTWEYDRIAIIILVRYSSERSLARSGRRYGRQSHVHGGNLAVRPPRWSIRQRRSINVIMATKSPTEQYMDDVIAQKSSLCGGSMQRDARIIILADPHLLTAEDALPLDARAPVRRAQIGYI